MSEIATATKLCAVCSEIFELKQGEKPLILREETNNDYRDHHCTMENFLEAVRQECFICTKVWSYVRNQYQTDWISDLKSWRPLTYNLNAVSRTQQQIVLSIRWSSMYLNFTTPVVFHLSPISGSYSF